MRKEEILKKIGVIINDLNDQQQYLADSEDYNDLELELFTANADFLIDHIEILKKLQNSKYVTTSVTQVEHSSPSIILPEIEETIADKLIQAPTILQDVVKAPFNFTDNSSEIRFDFEQNVPIENIFDRELTPAETEVLQTKQVFFEKLNDANRESAKDVLTPVEEKNELLEQNIEAFETPTAIEEIVLNQIPVFVPQQVLEPLAEINIDKPNIEDNLSSSKINLPIADNELLEVTENKKQTLNEFLSNQNNVQNISSRLGNLATNDLKSAISLNDKMIFIKELFQGYNLAYSEAIEILNRFDAFESADNFLQKNYATKNKWVEKQDIVDRFYEILNRRYVK
ncbi:MAG: hypothetical protein EAZ15_02500 [Sphingobacteriales bacterium]|nr:MAG: hypothetical protein EAZ15_02500 [Sphingobacteriales bacterium]